MKIPRFLCLFLVAAVCAYPVDREIVPSPTNPSSPEAFEKGETVEDTYLEGYIQALVNAHYYEFDVLVKVRKHRVFLYNLPKNALIRKSIISFVRDLPEVTSVEEVFYFPDDELKALEKREVKPQIKGTWFPQQTVLYAPMLANPRALLYSAVYRVGDHIMGTKSVAVGLADNFPIFRWRNVFKWQGDLQLDIQAGAWSVFKLGLKHRNGETSELVNTDYLLGIPLSYAVDNWSFRFRVYHISSHLGDEFLCWRDKCPDRVNPSFEAFDFFSSYQIGQNWRVYFGPGWIFHSDQTYDMKHFYVEYGFEGRFCGSKSHYHRLYSTPFLAAYFRNWQAVDWKFDQSYMLGYEWSKLQGLGRKFRIFIEAHHGYSEGQFFKDITTWGGVGLSWGF